MIEIVQKTGIVSNVGDGCRLHVRLAAKARVRCFVVRPGSVKELRKVGGTDRYCPVADAFLASELSAIASATEVTSTVIH